MSPGLQNSTRPLIFTSASGCRARESFDISSENQIFPIYTNNICDAGQVPILRYFEAWSPICYDVVDTQKNHLTEMVLLSTHDIHSVKTDKLCWVWFKCPTNS